MVTANQVYYDFIGFQTALFEIVSL